MKSVSVLVVLDDMIRQKNKTKLVETLEASWRNVGAQKNSSLVVEYGSLIHCNCKYK
jgi:hypothetical protein